MIQFLLAVTIAALPLSLQAHALQPLVSIDTAGIGGGAAYTLSGGDELQFTGTFFGTGTSGSGTYGLTGASGANPVQLSSAYNEHISTGALTLNYNHFFKPEKPFFVSAGIVANLFHADGGTVTTNSTLVFGGNSYSAAQLGILGVHVRWQPIDPYLGFGWASKNANRTQRGPRFEIGAYEIGKAHVSFTPQGVVAVNPAIFGPYLDSLQGKLENDLSGLTIYPVLRVSIPVGASGR